MVQAGRKTAEKAGSLVVKIEPWGPGASSNGRGGAGLVRHPALAKLLEGTHSELLQIKPLYSRPKIKTNQPPAPPSRFEATFFDYTNNQAILASGYLNAPQDLEIRITNKQPLPTKKEFDAAVKILRNESSEIASALQEGLYLPYRPMPPLIQSGPPGGRSERTIAIGLLPVQRAPHLLVGVSMIRRTVEKPTQIAAAGVESCGLESDPKRQANVSAPGAAWITVTQDGAEVWKFLALRPAATGDRASFPSSLAGETVCTNGGGIELWNVDYLRKRVLYRADVPILNVRYQSGLREYRDWENEESQFKATGTDPAEGFRQCDSSTIPETILDSGVDVGDFLGVAVYVEGQEVVLVSELEASWYRYISEWRFHTDGTIRPRWGFSAVKNEAVCEVHYHHAYWRFDFDIGPPENNIVREFTPSLLSAFSSVPLLGEVIKNLQWRKKFYTEAKRHRKSKSKWRILNAATKQGYELIPGHHDVPAKSMPDWPQGEFPAGDLWILRNHHTEIDDGAAAPGPPQKADIDQFVNGEPVYKRDVVIWYGGHVTHDFHADPPGTHGHIVGPTLRPLRWSTPPPSSSSPSTTVSPP